MKLLLHIGTGKTGSTSIQNTLSANRLELAKVGILYPRISRRIDHNLLAIATNPAVPREFNHLVANDDRNIIEKRVWKEAADWVAKRSGDTLVLSCEYFSAGVDVDRLQDLIMQHFPKVTEIETICYLRPPVSAYLSRLQQDIKASSLISRPKTPAYAPLLNRYRKLGTVTPRLFHRAALCNGDVVADFLSLLPSTSKEVKFSIFPESNTSISAEGMAILQEFRLNIFPDHNNIFMPESTRLLKMIKDIETEVGKDTFTQPCLRPEIVNLLTRDTTDLEILRDQYGIDLFAYTPPSQGDASNANPIDFPANTQNLSLVIRWDEARKVFLTSSILQELLQEKSKASPAL